MPGIILRMVYMASTNAFKSDSLLGSLTYVKANSISRLSVQACQCIILLMHLGSGTLYYPCSCTFPSTALSLNCATVSAVHSPSSPLTTEGDVEARRRLAKGIAESLRRTGCCVVRDPRVGPQDNCQFLDTMEAYFAQPAAAAAARCVCT